MNPKTSLDEVSETPWQDALLAIELLIASLRNGSSSPFGIAVKASSGPVLDHWVECVSRGLGKNNLLKIPTHIDLDRLLGGLDLSATLASGRRIEEPGLLSKADGKAILLSNVATMETEIESALLSAIDHCEIVIERDGISSRHHSSFSCVLVYDEDEVLAHGLLDRMTLHIDLTDVDIRQVQNSPDISLKILSDDIVIRAPESEVLESIAELACAFGISSLRPSQQAVQVAQIHALMGNRRSVQHEDLEAAVRLSLLPRAVVMPFEDEDEEQPEAQQPQSDEFQKEADSDPSEQEVRELEDLSVDAILANLPSDLLEAVSKKNKQGRSSVNSGRVGRKDKNFKRGRPISSIKRKPSSNKRLDILSTLRAAAPWQRMRKAGQSQDRTDQIQIRSSDFHIKRFKKPAESTSIFVVDASGSTAINRLGEAKGAIELVLTESYARRDYVSLIALKGRAAELILSPTRSLVMAKRTLSGLTGGGGTPLADGLQKALILANEEQRKGRSPTLIVLTDGSANVDLSGQSGRKQAQLDAFEVARHIAISGYSVMVVDVSKLVGKQAKELAEACHSHYVPMPFANASSISDSVNKFQSVEMPN